MQVAALSNAHHDAYRSPISENTSPINSSHAALNPTTHNSASSHELNSDENVAVAFNPTDTEPETGSDLSFKKKDVKKARTQSFQSVLSTASLKSMKLNAVQSMNQGSRTASVAGTNQNGASSNAAQVSVKDFQSFIQAPVLSSTSTYKNTDESEIGRQLPFSETPKEQVKRGDTKSTATKMDDAEFDQQLIIQQQKLTLNALKKLSLSPMPFIHVDETTQVSSRPTRRELTLKKNVPEPYQPAQVDLSSFASLTRQPRFPEHTEKIRNSVPNLPRIHDLPVEEKEHQSLDNPNREDQVPQSGLFHQRTPLDLTHPQNLLRSQSALEFKARGPLHHQIHSPTQIRNSAESHPHIATPAHAHSRSPVAGTVNQFSQTPSMTSQLPHRAPQTRSSSFQNSAQDHRVPAPAVQQPHDMLRRKGLNLSVSAYSQFQPPSQQQRHQPHNLPQLVSLSQAAKLGTNVRQIKGLRTPMYVPAVLRMTNKSSVPVREVKEPVQEDDSGGDSAAADSSNEELPAPRSSALKSTFSQALVWSQELSRSQTLTESGYSNAIHHQKTTPTRKHWMRDESATRCGIKGCPVVFNFFERRHHCRKCGGIFCSEHTSHYLYINHMAQFTTGGRGILSKVCNNCISDYNKFINNEFGVNVPVEDPKPLDTPVSSKPTSTINAPAKTPNPNARNDSVVGSVPANWTWSSF